MTLNACSLLYNMYSMYFGDSKSIQYMQHNISLYRKNSNKRLASNKNRRLIGAGCTGTLNLKNASNYIPLVNACLQ